MKHYIQLNVRSLGSHGERVITPAEIVDYALREGAKAVAITDLNSVQAFPEFSRVLRKRAPELKGIYGAQLHCLDRAEEPILITLLAKNRDGLTNLYRILSAGFEWVVSEKVWPCVKLEDVLRNRDGLLIGRLCSWPEILHDANKEENTLWFTLEERYRDFDYAEILPWSQDILEQGCQVDANILKAAAKKIAGCLQLLGKTPVAVYGENRTLPKGQGFSSLKSTQEVLKDFAYLDDLRDTAVLDNPERIARQILRFYPFDLKPAPLLLPDAESRVRSLCLEKAKEKYGEDLPVFVLKRLRGELDAISDRANSCPDIWSVILLLYGIADVCRSRQYPFLLGNSLGSTFVAYLLGITAINPLPPHLYCPMCRRIVWHPDRRLQNIRRHFCPECHAEMSEEGQGLMPESIWVDGGRSLSLELPEETIPPIFTYLENTFGKDHVFAADSSGSLYSCKSHPSEVRKACFRQRLAGWEWRQGRCTEEIVITDETDDIFRYTPVMHQSKTQLGAGTIQLPSRETGLFSIGVLPTASLSALYWMRTFSKVRAEDIRLNDADIADFFQTDSLLGIPLSQRCRTVIKEAQPRTFPELLQAIGHGWSTGTWEDNAKILVENGFRLTETIAFPEDVMHLLERYGMDSETAFQYGEFVKNGRSNSQGFSPEDKLLFREYGVPAWLVASMEKIRCLIPRNRAVEQMQIIAQLIFYKRMQPLIFYAGALSAKIPPGFDTGIFTGDMESLEKALDVCTQRLWEGNVLGTESETLRVHRDFLALGLESMKKGYSFQSISNPIPDRAPFFPENGKIQIAVKESLNKSSAAGQRIFFASHAE